MVEQGKRKEFWRWPESNWVNPDIDWKKGKFITAGVDVGSVSTQAVVMVDSEFFAFGNTRTGSDSPNSASNGMGYALEKTDMKIENIDYCIGTGYGTGQCAHGPTIASPRSPAMPVGPTSCTDPK